IGATQPFPELFFSTADGLLRFVVLIEDGRPDSLSVSLAFNGTEFSFDSEATDTIDPGTLIKVGCSTAFPVYAPSGSADAGFTELYVLVGNRYFLFTGEGATPADPGVPAGEATPPPAVPTQEATPAPTEVSPPAAPSTPVPTDVPPTEVPPTEVPPTEVPTEVPPTDVPPTEVPPTEVPPTDVPATEVPPTEVPPTEVPSTPVPTEAPPTDAPVDPSTSGTPSSAPVDPAATVDPSIDPSVDPAGGATPSSGAAPDSLPVDAVAAGLPPEVTIQNNTYVFNQLNVDIDVSTLVQVEVQNIQGVNVTVYAEQNVEIGQAPRLYCVGSNGQVVGEYVPAAPSAPAPAAAVTPAPLPEEAAAAGLPPEVTVENNTYVFNQVNVDIDVSTLVQVEVQTIQNVEVTVYAEQNVAVGQAPRLYCVAAKGAVVGQYVPVTTGAPAAVAPPPAPVTPAPVPEEAAAAGLPPQVDIENNTYVFNEVNIDIDISTLVEVDVVTVQNVELTVYAEQNVQLNQAPRLYLVGTGGAVVGQYVVAGIQVSTRPAATAPVAPVAVVPTLSPNAPPPAIATAIPRTTCQGEPGEINAQGLPSHLLTRIQLGGVAYTFVGVEEASAAGTLTRISCIGAFEAVSTDLAEQSQVIFLRVSATSQQVYRFEAALTYQIEFQVSEQPRSISTLDQRYQLRQTWQASVYSSTSVLLFVEDVENSAPEVFYGVNVSQTVVGESIGEYRLPGETATASEAMVAAAERTGLNVDLTINGQVYILVNVYEPTGTTSNGFITLFGTAAEGDPAMLLGRDKRELELYVFELAAPAAPSTPATPTETGG
ncbi:MAG: hypothetical protein H0W23_05750, partial [Chloroflexia bacterium]|nr:hypothetical protein [Chloroflexia bacterium]